MSAIKRFVAIMAACVLALCVGAFAASRYMTRSAGVGKFVIRTSLNGGIQYLKTGAAVMRDDNATLLTMEVATGDRVEAGQLVATYSVDVSYAEVVRAENALSEAKDDYEYGLAYRQAAIESYRSAVESGTDPVDKRINELLLLKAEKELEVYLNTTGGEISALEASLEAVKASRETRCVYAPMDGIVDSVATAGIAIAKGKTVITLYDPESAVIICPDPKGELKYGMEVDIQLSGRNRQANTTGTVVGCDNVRFASQRSGYAYILCDAAKAGGYYSVSVSAVTLEVVDALIVSSSTLNYNNGSSFVRILDNSESVSIRYVSKGFENASETWILFGINDGDRLIVK